MKFKVIIIALLIALFSAVALAEEPVFDDRGIEIAVRAPERVVCLYGSYAEVWLQAGGMPAGVTEDAISERALILDENTQIIGTTKEPNLELVIALDPDLVIYSLDISQQLSAAEVLEGAGVPCAGFRVDAWQDYARMMGVFTAITGRADLYEATIPPLQAEIEAILSSAAENESPRVLLLRAFSSGVRAKAADNLAGIMLADLGCTNIADGDDSILEDLSLEAIVAADPEHIFISVMGGDEEAALATVDAQLGANPAWQAMTAVQAGNVHLLPRELFHYKPNSRWGESYAYLANILYGE
ncbi:MAG: ABC transporter substrate-binding protein [Clostridia bacterium]|nr:ABC transporter substrate-binding protein [Clostridia bacterium]